MKNQFNGNFPLQYRLNNPDLDIALEDLDQLDECCRENWSKEDRETVRVAKQIVTHHRKSYKE